MGLRAAFRETAHARREAEHARQEAERAKQLMENVLALVSHDLRNPLGVVKMGTQLILESPESNEHQPILSMMLRNLEQVDSMIGTLLDVTRMNAGKTIPLNMETCNLAVELGRIIEVQALAQRTRISFVAAEPVWGTWGLSGICRMLQNLLSNAIKYGTPDTPIDVKLERRNGRAILSVHNYGKAIPVEDQKNLFQAFQRTPGTENGNVRGWGLGLALVSGIAEAHGGFVKVESSKDAGTTFFVDLPIQDVEKKKAKDNFSKDASNRNTDFQI